jgi:hypothetical protein
VHVRVQRRHLRAQRLELRRRSQARAHQNAHARSARGEEGGRMDKGAAAPCACRARRRGVRAARTPLRASPDAAARRQLATGVPARRRARLPPSPTLPRGRAETALAAAARARRRRGRASASTSDRSGPAGTTGAGLAAGAAAAGFA